MDRRERCGMDGFTRGVLVLACAAMLPACGSSGGGGGNPIPGVPALPAGVTQLQSGYILSTFATSPAGSTKPDSIVQAGNTIIIGYQDQLNSDGTNPGGVPPGQGNNQIVQYDMSGNVLQTFVVTGHNDGILLFDSNTLWVMSNEDSGPYLNVINLTTAAVTKVSPSVLHPVLHGGGYDDMIMIDGTVYVSCSNPSAPGTHLPLVVTISINAGGTFDSFPVVYSDVGTGVGITVTDVTTGSTLTKLGYTDPDSMTIAPNGDLMVDGQGDSSLAFIHSPGVAGAQQFVNVLPITLAGQPWPIDDTRFAKSTSSFMLVTDTGAGTIYRIDPPAGGFQTGTISSTAGTAFSGTAYSAGGGGVYTLNLVTGALSAIFTGMTTPHGLRFISTPTLSPGVTSVNPAYTVSLFANAPDGSSKPDSIVELGGNIYIGYQGQLNTDGTIPPNAFGVGPEGFVSVVEYDPTGKVLKTYSIEGHIDGMLALSAAAADGSNLWVMSNEDANPILTTIVTATGVQTVYLPAVPPAHGGGYDDLSQIGANIYVSCSNPTTPGQGPIVGVVTLNTGLKTFNVAPFISGGSVAMDNTGAVIPTGLAFTDTDSMEVDPNGNLVVAGQGDSSIAFHTKVAVGPAPSTAPVLALGTAGGSTTNGTHVGYVTFVNASGETYTSPPSAPLNVTLTNQINWSAIPTGPLGTTSRNLYITIAGNTGFPLLVGSVAGNIATTTTTNKADGSLGVASPAIEILGVTLFGNPLPADDVRYVPTAPPQFLLVTDPSANQIYKITAPAGWPVGGVFDAGALSVNSLNTVSGLATPIVTGMKAPHGMLFVH